jgi:hypothetical protein
MSTQGLEEAAMKLKKIRNAEAARRFRNRKKEKDKEMFESLQNKVSQLESRIQELQKERKKHIAQKTEWITHQNYYVNLLQSVRAQFKKQREYVSKLENMLNSGTYAPHPFAFPPPPPPLSIPTFENGSFSTHPLNFHTSFFDDDAELPRFEPTTKNSDDGSSGHGMSPNWNDFGVEW